MDYLWNRNAACWWKCLGVDWRWSQFIWIHLYYSAKIKKVRHYNFKHCNNYLLVDLGFKRSNVKSKVG